MKKILIFILVLVLSTAPLVSCERMCDHNYSDWETVKQPTCTSSGKKEATCDECGKIRSRSISPLGHKYANGVCTVCGMTTADDPTIPTEPTTYSPSESFTELHTEPPVEMPSETTTELPSEAPSDQPTEKPTEIPTEKPTEIPTDKPAEIPTEKPTDAPTEVPTEKPTELSTELPTDAPDEEYTEHAGTKNDPYSVSDAILVLDSLVVDDNGFAVTGPVYVKGVVVDSGYLSNNGKYFRDIYIADEQDEYSELYIYSANPNTDEDKYMDVGDTIILEGYLRIIDFYDAQMGSNNNNYTYFSVVGTGSGEDTPTETPTGDKMPAQMYYPDNHTDGDDILIDAEKNYIQNNPNNDFLLSTGLQSTGEYSALVIPVQFNNDSFTQSELDDLEVAFNGTEEQTGWHSVKTYYTKASYGALKLSFDIYPTPITMPNNYSSYEYDVYGSEDILEYALAGVDPDVDLSNYDTDGDGYIDAVYIIYSAPINYDSDESNFWAFVNWQFEGGEYDGVYAHYYFFASVDFMYEETESALDYPIEGLKINAVSYIHETGHLLGLDDYYDYYEGTGSDEGVGNADMMDATVGDHNAYSKLLLGWVSPMVITSTQTVIIESFESSGDFLMILLDYDGTYFSEYLLVDLYTATGLNEMHAGVEGSYLYDGESYGARIYHVSSSIKAPFSDDYGSFTDNNNSMTSYPLLKLVEADGDVNFESDIYDGYKYASYDDLWQSGDVLGDIQPGYTRNDGKLLCFDISFDEVTSSSATITVTFE